MIATDWLKHGPGCPTTEYKLYTCGCGMAKLVRDLGDNAMMTGDEKRQLLAGRGFIGHRPGCLAPAQHCVCGLHKAHPELWSL